MSATDNFIDRPQAPELSATELARWDAHPDAPESIRERVAAEIAHEDADAMLNPPADAAEHWERLKRESSWRPDYYRRCADRALRILTESALR